VSTRETGDTMTFDILKGSGWLRAVKVLSNGKRRFDAISLAQNMNIPATMPVHRAREERFPWTSRFAQHNAPIPSQFNLRRPNGFSPWAMHRRMSYCQCHEAQI
jgi:hypothetical protein